MLVKTNGHASIFDHNFMKVDPDLNICSGHRNVEYTVRKIIYENGYNLQSQEQFIVSFSVEKERNSFRSCTKRLEMARTLKTKYFRFWHFHCHTKTSNVSTTTNFLLFELHLRVFHLHTTLRNKPGTAQVGTISKAQK